MAAERFRDKIEKLIPADGWGRPLLWYASVGSTNDVALNLARQGFREGTVVGAEEQTKGRGRGDRGWFSPRGTGLWFSLILRPSLPPPYLGRIGLWTSLAVLEGVRATTGIDADLSWPNDILVRGRKLAGILAESSGAAGAVEYVVVGVGLNVNQDTADFPARLQTVATSLKEEVGKELDRAPLLANLLLHLRESYSAHSSNGFSDIAQHWKAHAGLLGKRVEIRWGTDRLTGQAADIGQDGELLLRVPSGVLRKIAWGQASIL